MINRINFALEQGSWSPHSAAYFESEALTIRRSDIAGGDMLLGIIAGANGDIAELHKRFGNSLACKEGDAVTMSNYGLALYNNGLFSQAVQILQSVAEEDNFSSEVMALSCLALGLTNKARHYYRHAGHTEEEFNLLCAKKKFPESKETEKGFDAVYESFDRDEALWKSLSTR